MNYRLSPSDLTFTYEGCKRCFYHKVVENITLPSMPFPAIFSKMASLLKNHYDGKHTSELHVALPPGTVSHGEKNVRSEIIQLSNHKATCYISGRFDIVVSFNDGSYGVIDFKTGKPSKESAGLYSRQLHAYAYALEHPSTNALALSPVTKLGLLYFFPESVSQQNIERLAYESEITWVEIEKDEQGFLKFMDKVLDVLELTEAPKYSPNCQWCGCEETLDMLRSGLSPKEITQKRGVSINTTLTYLDQLVGQGDLRRSDILFSVHKDIRQAVIAIAGPRKDPQVVIASLQRTGIDIDLEDVQTVLKYSDARYALGDMYEDIRTIETHLHQLIQETLEEKYGEELIGWWRQGIPEPVRKSCVIRQEEDPDPVPDPYCYTELLDLWHILDKQWTVLSKVLPDKLKANKQDLRRKIARLNTIRRNVMHPVRGVVPSEDDFEFIHDLKEVLINFNYEKD